MTTVDYAVLIVDPDPRLRALLASQLASVGCAVLQASDGESALRIVRERAVRLVLTELYLKAGDDDDLIHAIRRTKTLRHTRTIAHTSKATAADRDWAMRAGADAYLIKPTRAERLRDVVTRLATTRGANSSVPVTSHGSMSRRDSLEVALAEAEKGGLRNASSIVFARQWWEALTATQQTAFRKRAKRARLHLHSDSALGNHFVEVRGTAPEERKLSTERQESPYRV